MLPAICMHFVTVNREVRTRITRTTVQYFSYTTCRTLRQERDVGHRGAVLWESLPFSIALSPSIMTFKKLLKLHHLSNY